MYCEMHFTTGPTTLLDLFIKNELCNIGCSSQVSIPGISAHDFICVSFKFDIDSQKFCVVRNSVTQAIWLAKAKQFRPRLCLSSGSASLWCQLRSLGAVSTASFNLGESLVAVGLMVILLMLHLIYFIQKLILCCIIIILVCELVCLNINQNQLNVEFKK